MIAETNWQKTTLGEIARKDEYGLVDGPFGSNLPASLYVPFGVPVIRGSNLTLGRRRFVDDQFVFVSKETANRLRRSICGANDIIFTKKGTLGQTAIIPPDHQYTVFLISSNQMKLSVNPRIADPLFVYYSVSSAASRQKILRDAEATGVPKTNLRYLRAFPILLPPLAEQGAIARVLGTLDDKIDLNRRMNETLEAIAQALFRKYFVLPTRASLPQGWRSSTLGEHIELRRGTTYKSSLKDRPGPYLLGLSSIRRNGGFRRDSLSTYGGESSAEILLGPGELYVSLKDVTQSADLLGSIARVPSDIQQGRLTQDTVRLLSKNTELPSCYVYQTLRTREYREYCRARATGTTNLGLSRADFLSYKIVIPPADFLQKFDSTVQLLERRCDLNDAESCTLRSLRDALLPKLLSGAVHIDGSTIEARD
jgi:type I restriction enzyme S subunit